jgi:cyclopropane fatty-acyl-phospholipid synthase-like methyltransferase
MTVASDREWKTQPREDWRAIWERKGRTQVARRNLATLIALDGFDGGAGRLGPSQFYEIAHVVVAELTLQAGMRVLEVGCGAGALLWCLRGRGFELFGADFSAPMLAHARAALPGVEFALAEARDLPFDDQSMDAIVCNSVFQ